ncbi:DNA primase catalytic subunit PriS [Methanoplanus endosymbiosus]|uniref:DNA primase small subunit PriS n=1 Tax=Methanoplanus endosymbiosus TaxID=33865 RepID=A0A9E7PPU3_9EURY|nr:DNA primase catalytic subunit PriS [Methanoplanus endosymbiosus]UUX92816.1 DNA primase catalytic subunit PriS [Methanoplanus endosymbiosus]
MNAATLEYLKQNFQNYYKKATIEIPPALEQREWGFIFFDTSDEVRMKRHISFSSKPEVENYLRAMIPRHVYHSTAYYRTPSAGTMPDKEWCGADLIFDLDADHIVRGAYDLMLARVKEEVFKLIAMLRDELGFSEKDMFLVFSGGRGYHIHIRNLEVLGWSSAERRGIVDYVCGTGIDPQIMLKSRMSGSGWPERYREILSEYLAGLSSVEKKSAVKKITALRGIGEKSALNFIESSPALSKALTSGREGIVLSETQKKVFEVLKGDSEEFKEIFNKRAVLTDEPVTTDIKRLIRMPGSLHGGSSMRVVSMPVSELDGFDPLTDAVVFGEDEIIVDSKFPVTMPILGNKYSLDKGINRVPEALALFLCARGIAEYSGAKR